MVIVMGPQATEDELGEVVAYVEAAGGSAFVSRVTASLGRSQHCSTKAAQSKG